VAHADVIEGLTAAAVEVFRGDLQRIVIRLRGVLRAELKKAHVEKGKLVTDSFNAELAAKLEARFSGLLAELGYDGAIGKLLDTFEEVQTANNAFLEDRLGESLSAADARALARIASGAEKRLLLRGGEAGAKLRDILVVGANTNAPIADLVEELAAAADVELQKAVVEAQTQLMGFQRDALETQAEESGVDLYTYDGPGGPDDLITRPFCAPLVGKIVTLPDLDQMDNGDGQPRPVSRFLGGYRCRHSLSPLSLEEGLDMVEREGPGVIAPGCRLARAILLRGKEGPAHAAWVARNAGAVVNGKVVRRKRRSA
jgi:hypothetical protein